MLTRIKAFFLFVLAWLGTHLMPARLRKGILLSIVDRHLQQSGFLKCRPLERTNEVIGMAYSAQALLLPVLLYDRLWGHETFLQTLRLSDWDGRAHDFCAEADLADQLSQSIFDMTPKWLRYANREAVLKDIHMLLTCPIPNAHAHSGPVLA